MFESDWIKCSNFFNCYMSNSQHEEVFSLGTYTIELILSLIMNKMCSMGSGQC